MHPEDTKFAKGLKKFLKSAKASNDSVDRILRSLPPLADSPARDVVRGIAGRFVGARPESDGTVVDASIAESMEALLRMGFRETVSVLLEHDAAVLAGLDQSKLLLFGVSETTISAWVKARSGREEGDQKELAGKLIESAMAHPERAMESALASWVCRAMPPGQLGRLVPLVVIDFHGKPSKRLLETVLLRDKDGNFVTEWLAGEPDRIPATAEIVRRNPKCLRHVLDSAWKWLGHSAAKVLRPFYADLMEEFPRTKNRRRSEWSGNLLSLAGTLVPMADKNETAGELLQDLQRLGIRVWKDSEESGDRHRTWAFIQSGNKSLAGESGGLSREQAKLLGIAIMRARKGKDALAELESAFVNLGVARFGREGERVAYDAIIHNDLDGGLLPGDEVLVKRSGFRLGKTVLVKADVTGAPDR